MIAVVAAFLLAILAGAYGGWILWDQEASGIMIPIGAIALLLIGGLLAMVSLDVGRVPLRRVALVLVAAAVGLLVGYGVGPKREPLIQQFGGTLTLHLESPVVADATGPSTCLNVASGTEFYVGDDSNLRLETPDSPFVTIWIDSGDRWQVQNNSPRKNGVLLHIGISGALVTDAGKPSTIGMQATESSTLASTFSKKGGSIRFADLAPQTSADFNGESMNLAGTIEWTCGPAAP
ncbi:MAG: hypothetical protein ABI598_01550 [Chloroflexota bacterium]